MNGLCSWPGLPDGILTETKLMFALSKKNSLQLGFDSEIEGTHTGIYRKIYKAPGHRRVYAFYSSTKKSERRHTKTSTNTEAVDRMQTRSKRRKGRGDILYEKPVLVEWSVIHSMNRRFQREFERDGIWFIKCCDDDVDPRVNAVIQNDERDTDSSDIEGDGGESSHRTKLVTPSPLSGNKRTYVEVENAIELSRELNDDLQSEHVPSDYWKSPECRKLFNVPDDIENGREFVEGIMETMRHAIFSVPHLKSLLRDSVNFNELRHERVVALQRKCLHLSKAFEIALLRLGCNKNKELPDLNWLECCREASIELGRYEKNKDGVEWKQKHIMCPRTISRWNRSFRILHRLDVKEEKDRTTRPYFLVNNQLEANMIKSYVRENLSCFRPEDLADYIRKELIRPLAVWRILERKGYMVNRYEFDDEGDRMNAIEEVLLHHPDVEPDDDEMEEESLAILHENHLEYISTSTVYRWLTHLGFKYSDDCKSYYSDNHEREDVVEARIEFVKWYVEVEKRMFRWVRVSHNELDALINDGKLDISMKAFGKPIPGSDELEFHTDVSEELWPFISEENKPFGGDLSFFKPEGKPLINFGQDESIFEQNLFPKGSWQAPDGERVLRPKDRGYGTMISAFVSREFGFGMEFTVEEYSKINEYRKKPEHKEYKIKRCADLLEINIAKKDLNESPFVRMFAYGKNAEGYWKNEHMAIQFEDCLDCVMALYGDKYDFAFLYDNSSGHNKAQEDGLSARDMGVGYGGKFCSMRTTIIPNDNAGTYDNIGMTIQNGCEQRMSFDASDTGPMWMTSEERDWHKNEAREEKFKWKTDLQILNLLKDEFNLRLNNGAIPNADFEIDRATPTKRLKYLALKYDVCAAKKKEKCKMRENVISLSAQEMKDILAAEDLPVDGSLEMLRRRCTNHSLPITKVVRKGFVESWCNSPKGLQQILLERGIIDLVEVLNNTYTARGKKLARRYPGDKEVRYDESTSLVCIMAACSDFKQEKSILQYIGDAYHATVKFTPKYHCELAGEGIEYSWGFAKCIYRRIPHSEKKSLQKFLDCVKYSMSREVITVDRMRRFSRRARRYICSYYIFHGVGANDDEGNVNVKMDDLEKMVKMMKTHRCALDFDYQFIKSEDADAEVIGFQRLEYLFSGAGNGTVRALG